MIELFSLSLQAKTIVGGLIPLNVGTEIPISALETSHMFRDVSKNIFGASTLNRLTELSRSYQNVYVRCLQHPQTTFGV